MTDPRDYFAFALVPTSPRYGAFWFFVRVDGGHLTHGARLKSFGPRFEVGGHALDVLDSCRGSKSGGRQRRRAWIRRGRIGVDLEEQGVLPGDQLAAGAVFFIAVDPSSLICVITFVPVDPRLGFLVRSPQVARRLQAVGDFDGWQGRMTWAPAGERGYALRVGDVEWLPVLYVLVADGVMKSENGQRELFVRAGRQNAKRIGGDGRRGNRIGALVGVNDALALERDEQLSAGVFRDAFVGGKTSRLRRHLCRNFANRQLGAATCVDARDRAAPLQLQRPGQQRFVRRDLRQPLAAVMRFDFRRGQNHQRLLNRRGHLPNAPKRHHRIVDELILFSLHEFFDARLYGFFLDLLGRHASGYAPREETSSV